MRGYESAVAEVGFWRQWERKTREYRERKRRKTVAEGSVKHEKTQTPRLRAPVGTPGETGVGRPDGRKPEAGEGAGPGSGGVTGNPVIRRETHERQLGEGTVLGSKRCGYDIHGPGVTP